MDANLRNVRGGAQIDKGGAIAFMFEGEKEYLHPGDNFMSIAKARAVLKAMHHQPTLPNGKAKGNPVSNGKAWLDSRWIEVVWPEPEDAAPWLDDDPKKVVKK